jgi:hypothetical protein
MKSSGNHIVNQKNAVQNDSISISICICISTILELQSNAAILNCIFWFTMRLPAHFQTKWQELRLQKRT